MPDPLRICYLCEYPTLLGGERSLLAFLDGLTKPEFAGRVAPIVAAPGAGPLADALSQRNIPIVPWTADGKRGWPDLVPELRRLGVQLVHGNSLMIAETAYHLGQALGVPAISHVRDVMRLSERKLQILGQLSFLIAVSESVRNDLVKQGLPTEKVGRIYNGIDADAFMATATRGKLRAELGLQGDDVQLVGCIGQIALRKGTDAFIEAARYTAPRWPAARFVVVGARHSTKPESIAFERRIMDLADEPPLNGCVFFLGERNDVSDILADLDVLVVPSRQEPFSRVLLEAMSAGVPVVVNQVGGNQELIPDDRFGLLCDLRNMQEIGVATLILLGDDSLRQQYGAAVRRRVREQFSIGRQIQSLLSFYRLEFFLD